MQVKNPRSSLFAVFALSCSFVTLPGCATTSTQADPTTREALAVAEAWQQAIAQQDFDAAIALVARDFASDSWPERADLAYYFRQARQRDYFAGATIPDDPANVTLRGEEAVVYPVPIRAKLGLAVYRLMLERRDEQWTIVSVDQELY